MTNKKQDPSSDPFILVEQYFSQLLGESGCPWMKSQTHKSLIKYLLEETAETCETLQSQPLNKRALKEELGDLLLQIYFHAHLTQINGTGFQVSDIAQSLAEKLKHRNPHILGPAPQQLTKSEVEEQWLRMKILEGKPQPVGFPLKPSISALSQAQSIGDLAAQVHFDWDSQEAVHEKVVEELNETLEAIDSQNQTHIEEEIGDLLFAIVQWSRHLKIDAQDSLAKSNQKFVTRYNEMLNLANMKFEDFAKLSAEEKESWWQKAKSSLKK